MPDPRWMGPPELVAATFEAGPGPASTVASQLVWLTEAVNHELAMGLSAVNTAATSTQWLGLGAVASATTVTGLNTGLQTLVGWIAHKIGVTQAAVEAFAVAASTVVPAVVCQANRDQWAVLNATNFLGINTPAIVALDTEYFGEHYPHNSAIGWTYSAALAALSAALAVPPPIGPPGASAAAPLGAGQAIAQTAAGTAANDAAAGPADAAGMVASGTGPADGAGELTTFAGQAPQLISAVVQPVPQVAELPAKLGQALVEPAQSMTGSFGSFSGGMFPLTGAGAGAAVPEAAVPQPAVGAWRTGAGVTGGGVGGYPIGLTRYTQPANSFAAENAGRPIGLQAGMLAAARQTAETPRPPMAGGVPVSPVGLLHPRAEETDRDAVARARIVPDPDPNR